LPINHHSLAFTKALMGMTQVLLAIKQQITDLSHRRRASMRGRLPVCGLLRAGIPALGALALLSTPCGAHQVDTSVGPFYSGMLHPLLSNEHLLPMLALALVVSQCGRKAGYWSLALFPTALIMGLLCGRALPLLEDALRVAHHVALVILGGLLLVAARQPLSLIAASVALTGLILGFRSGIDWQASGVGFGFAPGLACSGIVVMALFGGGFPDASTRFMRTVRNICGVFFALIGVAMLSGYWSTGDGPMIRGVGWPTESDLTALVSSDPLSPALILAAFLGAALWGAGHALTPGHGKAIVAAYLIGARSTARHALGLGITVTVTHTLGVFMLGLLALFASRHVAPERLYPWLGAVSGLIVLLLGAVMVKQRLMPLLQHKIRPADADHAHAHSPADHDHGHTHTLPGDDGAPVTWRALIGLGVSGGMLPCPSALVLLLSAVSIQRTGFGMLLVIAFSLGLAGVLTTVGLLFVRGRRLIEGMPAATTVGRYVPAFSAVIITIMGLIITAAALGRMGSL
jgi:ABC-type nickel/cobalt efflux system permease component RcnA/hydrogenase/urease accessory protein HupE